MIKVKRSGNFIKMLDKLDDDPQMYDLIRQRIVLFTKNSKDTRLKNHALRKKMKGKFAFSITSDIRIVYQWLGKTMVRFLAIGGHSRVYK